MACCVNHCRMETTPEAAQKACEQSRASLIPNQVISPSVPFDGKILVKDLPDAHSFFHPLPVKNDLPPSFTSRPRSLQPPLQSDSLYLLTRSLLI